LNDRFITDRVVVRGAGELGSAVMRRLFLAGFQVVALEQPSPSCIRRFVCFAEAIHEGRITIEGVTAVRAESADKAIDIINGGGLPVLVDPRARNLPVFKAHYLVDARLLKAGIDTNIDMAPAVIGLGPGFAAGKNCAAAVETNRGIDLGRVIYDGACQDDTGLPAPVHGKAADRVLRSPDSGRLSIHRKIGDLVKAGDVVAQVGDKQVISLIDGVVRGLAREGLEVVEKQKIGDIDPRGITEYCFKISDKSNAVAGGVLEAVMYFKNRGARRSASIRHEA
jgi:xanthine dehydrogenase accessory factor